MLEVQAKELSPGQVAVLESLLKAGFRFVTFERYARYLGVERDGFVALLETAGGKVQLFDQVGYHVREGRKQKGESSNRQAESDSTRTQLQAQRRSWQRRFSSS